jgi:predicted RNase H-like HicB family nuclease
MQYAIVIEGSSNGFGAYVPDLPGCVAVAETEEEVRELIREAIEFHLDGLREDKQSDSPAGRTGRLRRGWRFFPGYGLSGKGPIEQEDRAE